MEHYKSSDDVNTTPSTSRSFNMSRIKAKNSKPELALRIALWRRNIRFRLHSNKVIGKPDIIISKYNLVIFVDGGFWHGFNWTENQKRIKTNREFWIRKIELNISRDKTVNETLQSNGYTVMRFWDHQILRELPKCVNQILLYIEARKTGKIPELEKFGA